MAHIAERSCTQYLPLLFGFTVTCCPDAKKIGEYLPEVRPSWFFSVPRIWEKLKAGLEAAIDGEEDEDRQKAMRWAVDVGLRKTRLIQDREEVPDELEQEWQKADEMVLAKMRERLGLDQLEAANVGAAPTPPEVIEFFHAIGVPLAEIWGMSETCGAGTANRPGNVRIGTVGPPSPGVEIRLAEDGEVCVKSDVVMLGYRNLPDKTAETMDDEGWLYTGDVGEWTDDGFLKIVDRKKELIISAGGKNMSPANIEAKVKAAGPLIGQAMAVGDNRPYNVALITLDPDAAPGFAREHSLDGDSVEDWAGEQAVIDAVQAEVDEANEHLAKRGADQALQGAAHRLGARRRRADPHGQAQAQADRREVRRGDRRAVRGVGTAGRGRPQAAIAAIASRIAARADHAVVRTQLVATRRRCVCASKPDSSRPWAGTWRPNVEAQTTASRARATQLQAASPGGGSRASAVAAASSSSMTGTTTQLVRRVWPAW